MSAEQVVKRVERLREKFFERSEGVRPGDSTWDELKNKVDRSDRILRSAEARMNKL